MAEIPANLRLITATVTIGTSSYTEHIQDFEFNPTSTAVEVTDVSGKVHKFAGESGWTCTLNVFQDFTSTGLARKMLDAEGEKAEIIIVDGPVTWESEISFVAPKIGGATKAVGVSPIVMPCSEPTPTATPAP